MTEEQKKIKKYVNAIERNLHMPLKMKARINSDLATEIHLRMEAGASADEVMKEMGSPKEVAERFNEEMGANRGERQYLRILFLCMTAFCAAIFLMFLLRALIQNWKILQEIKDSSVSIVGGADGPTSIFIAKSISPFGKGLMVLGMAAGFLSAYFLAGKRKEDSSVKYRCMILSAVGAVFTIFPSAQLWLLKFQGIAVGMSGDFKFIFIVGVVINLVTFIVALRKKKDGSS